MISRRPTSTHLTHSYCLLLTPLWTEIIQLVCATTCDRRSLVWDVLLCSWRLCLWGVVKKPNWTQAIVFRISDGPCLWLMQVEIWNVQIALTQIGSTDFFGLCHFFIAFDWAAFSLSVGSFYGDCASRLVYVDWQGRIEVCLDLEDLFVLLRGGQLGLYGFIWMVLT